MRSPPTVDDDLAPTERAPSRLNSLAACSQSSSEWANQTASMGSCSFSTRAITCIAVRVLPGSGRHVQEDAIRLLTESAKNPHGSKPLMAEKSAGKRPGPHLDGRRQGRSRLVKFQPTQRSRAAPRAQGGSSLNFHLFKGGVWLSHPRERAKPPAGALLPRAAAKREAQLGSLAPKAFAAASLDPT